MARTGPDTSPRFVQPAEWDTHAACWVAWPSHAEPWEGMVDEARVEFTGLCQAIASTGLPSATRPVERLEVLVDSAQRSAATKALQGLPVRFHEVPFGDIWLRDTAPIFVEDASGAVHAARFRFNGWGGKFNYPYDDQVALGIVRSGAFSETAHDWFLEGGSVDVDGEGTCLTTRQCLLNPNRNPAMNQAQIEAALALGLGVKKTLWLDEGLINDHTDGHIDTLARFVAPGVVLCMHPADAKDPNGETLKRIEKELASFTDAGGRKLRVVTIPSPGAILDDTGRLMPASYANFYIGNRTVVVPTYGSASDDAAVAGIAKLFPDRQTLGRPAKAILSGGGAFHCITQQQPLGKATAR